MPNAREDRIPIEGQGNRDRPSPLYEMAISNIVGLLIAALGGAAVGLERQSSGHADGPGARFAGIRTFTMLARSVDRVDGCGPPASQLPRRSCSLEPSRWLPPLVAGSRHDIDGTTEVAALVVLAAGCSPAWDPSGSRAASLRS